MRKFDILVIDDEEDPRHVWFRTTLGALGHQVSSAYDADQALEQLATRKFDVAFFDHDLGNHSVSGSAIAGHALNDPDTYHRPRSAWAHSMNYDGARNIASKFYSAGIPVTMESFAILQMSDAEHVQDALERLVPHD